MTQTKEQRAAELRDAAARSRLEYEDDKKARRARLKVAPVAKPDPFLLAGDIAEYVTVIEAFAADADDTELSRAVDAMRSQVTRVGNLLARRRATYKEEDDDSMLAQGTVEFRQAERDHANGRDRSPAAYRLWVNDASTVLVRLWPSGTVDVATRPHRSAIWGPPMHLTEENV